MIPFGASKLKAGAAALLLLFLMSAGAPAEAAFRDHFAEPDDIGAAKVPRLGGSRIIILIISNNPATLERSASRSFFKNELDSDTFRNYWNVNSLYAYDPQVIVVNWGPEPASFPPAPPDANDPASAGEWLKFIRDNLAALAENRESGGFEPMAFDINGPDRMPDGVLDGVIALVDGVEGVFPIPADASGEIKIGNVQPGPLLIAGHGASDYEILLGFAGLLGFADMGAGRDSRGGVCLSLIGNLEEGIPLLDGYSRLRAGWANPFRIEGPAREIFLLPARTSGEVYVVGGESEYFLLENRSAGGGCDSSIDEPGIAIYHIDERKPPDAAKSGPAAADVWHPAVMNEWPDGSFPIQKGGKYSPNDALFRDGGGIAPDYKAQNPIGEKFHPLNSNWYSGEPSDIVIKNIDTRTHYPIISATIGTE